MSRRKEEREEFRDAYDSGDLEDEDIVFYPFVDAPLSLARFYHARGVHLRVELPRAPHDSGQWSKAPYLVDPKKGFLPASTKVVRLLRGADPWTIYGGKVISRTDAVFTTCACECPSDGRLFLDSEVEETNQEWEAHGLLPVHESKCPRCSSTYTQRREGYIVELAMGSDRRDSKVSVYL